MGTVGFFRCLAGAWLAAILGATSAGAADLLAPADPGALSGDERRVVQTALAVQGLYAGLADGAWSKGADAALARYAARRFEAAPLNAHLAALTLDFAKARARDGWQMVWRPRERAAFAVPAAILTLSDRQGMRVWSGDADDLMILLSQGDAGDARALHRLVEGKAADPAALARLRRDGALLTSARNGAGRSYFARSARMDGIWTTVMLIADPARKDAMNGIAASLSFGAPTEWALPDGGALSALVAQAVAAWESAQTPGAGGPGAGFYVSGAGEALTHAHVVTGCAAMASGDHVFRIAAVDVARDLALLRPEAHFAPPAIAAFAAGPARSGAVMTVAGRPASLLDEAETLGLSVAVAPAAAGAPVIDRHGLVAGVAVSALDAAKIGGAPGHAVRGAAAKRFLSAQGVDFRVGIPGGAASRTDAFTIALTCK